MECKLSPAATTAVYSFPSLRAGSATGTGADAGGLMSPAKRSAAYGRNATQGPAAIDLDAAR